MLQHLAQHRGVVAAPGEVEGAQGRFGRAVRVVVVIAAAVAAVGREGAVAAPSRGWRRTGRLREPLGLELKDDVSGADCRGGEEDRKNMLALGSGPGVGIPMLTLPHVLHEHAELGVGDPVAPEVFPSVRFILR